MEPFDRQFLDTLGALDHTKARRNPRLFPKLLALLLALGLESPKVFPHPCWLLLR
jgi:hypothetical protein